MWTPETRRRHDRQGLRYTHDLTDEEWTLVAPLIPPAKRGGNKRTVEAREIVNGLMYILGIGCQWRDIPRTCRRVARSMTISTDGITMGRYNVFITRSMGSAGHWLRETPAPP